MLMLPGCIFLLLVIIAPIISTFGMSLTNYNFMKPQSKTWVGFQNYVDIFKDPFFWETAWHTLIYVVSAVTLEFALGTLLALFFFKLNKENSVLMSFFILPSVISPIVVGLIFRYMLNTEFGFFTYIFNKLGLFTNIALLGNSATALPSIIVADIWQWTPFMTLMIISGLLALPSEPYEAARVDGANGATIFFRITLPLLIPVVRVSLMLRIADAIKEFDKIFVMTDGGPGTATETLNYYSYRVNFRYFTMGKGSALVTIILVFIIIISVIMIKMMKSVNER